MNSNLPFALALSLVLSCGPAPSHTPRIPPSSPHASSTPCSDPAAAVSPRPPPLDITTPMVGEPASADLTEARLVTSDCQDYNKLELELTEERVKEMKERVDESFREWVLHQPLCWQEYRWKAEEERARSIGEAFGAGGLGLSGVGQGGGGYGSGHGRLAPQVRFGALYPPRAATSASGTNNQVAGVDEPDIVKTDGRFVYFAMNGALRIVEAMSPRSLSVTKLPGNVRDLFVEGDRAVVYTASGSRGRRCTYGYDCRFSGDGTSTSVMVFDIANRSAPRLVRQIEMTGSLMAARRIGSAVHTVVADGDSPTTDYPTWPHGFDMCGNTDSVVRARLARLKIENERKIRAQSWTPLIREKGVDRRLCDRLLRSARDNGRVLTTVVSFDLRKDQAPAVTASVQSRPGAVFASSNALYLSVVQEKQNNRGRWYSFYSSVDEVSAVHKFRIGADPVQTAYVGSGVVPGHVLNQFAMDEWYGYLRIATTRGWVPDPAAESAVSILAQAENGNLVRVGAIEKIAPGEDIRSVRFDDDRGYVVTFKKTDPLFVLDLYNPAHPSILGELKIPGFSTYMHRIDPGHLLSIGFDANDHGDFAFFDGLILQLFDVVNPTAPKLLHKEKIGTRGSSSEAATDHLAFNYFAEKGLLAIPVTVCEGGGDGSFGNELSFSGLVVYDVSLTKGFRRLGGINHGTRNARCAAWWSSGDSAVKRSIFLDDLVYSIANDRAKVQRMGHFGEDLADISLVR